MTYTLIDTHAHLNFQAFKDDIDKVLRQAQDEGVTKIINVGADLNSSQKAVELAQKYDCCYASVGIHPHHAGKHGNTEEITKTLEKIAENPKVVAIGECGLDYHSYQNGGIADPQRQKELFLTQLKIAQELNLPVIFHCRSASAEASADRDVHSDILEIIKPYALTGVFHCFSGDKKFLEAVLGRGFYVGFDGNITYKNAQNLRDLVKATPIERLLLETDCPYLSPEPFRGLRNVPTNVKIVARACIQIKNLPEEEIFEKTTANAQKLFSF